MGQGLGKTADGARELILIEGLYASGRSTLAASLKIATKEKPANDADVPEQTHEEEIEMHKQIFRCEGGLVPYRGYKVFSSRFYFGGRGVGSGSLLDQLYHTTAGLVFVIDSSEPSGYGFNLQDAKTELDLLRKNPQLNGAVIIAVANKQDLPDAKTADEVETFINDGAKRKIKVFPATAINGEGMFECFDWLVDEVTGQRKQTAVTEPWKEVAGDVKKDGNAGIKAVKGAWKRLVSNRTVSSNSTA